MSLSLLIFLLIALVTLGSAAVAFLLKDIIRSALLLVVSWAGIAAFYLWAGAEFVAFAQVLVYVGAILMIILFGVVLTRRTPVSISTLVIAPPSWRAFVGLGSGALVAAAIIWGILRTDFPQTAPDAPAPVATMQTLGLELMGQYAGALLIVGALLTVALLGAVLLAAQDKERPNSQTPNPKIPNPK